jgi:hypothetical protein
MAGQVHVPASTNRREPAALGNHLFIEYERALGHLGGARRAAAHHAVALDAPLGLPRIREVKKDLRRDTCLLIS